MLSPEIGNRLAGVTDGEGHFGIRSSRRGFACYYIVKLRADDLILVERLQWETNLGVISWVKAAQTTGRANNPAVMWRVQSKEECLAVVDIFGQYPLWGKKADEFPIWAKAVRYSPHPHRPHHLRPGCGEAMRDQLSSAPTPEGSTPLEKELVAVHTEGPHEHITRARLADGTEETADGIIAAIETHFAHYWAQGRLVRVQRCPDCNEKVIWS